MSPQHRSSFDQTITACRSMVLWRSSHSVMRCLKPALRGARVKRVSISKSSSGCLLANILGHGLLWACFLLEVCTWYAGREVPALAMHSVGKRARLCWSRGLSTFTVVVPQCEERGFVVIASYSYHHSRCCCCCANNNISWTVFPYVRRKLCEYESTRLTMQIGS